MTEQQFEKLKTLLDNSNAAENSVKLDEAILMAAKLREDKCAQEKVLKQTELKPGNKLIQWGVSFFQAGVVQSAALSVTLTLILFFVLGQVLKPQEVTYKESGGLVLDNSGLELSSVPEIIEKNKVQMQNQKNALAYNRLPEPETASPRDQILAQMTLPDIQALVDGMSFNQKADRQLAQSLVSIAMQDIKKMLDSGELDNARLRYEKLKQSCDVCMLPTTLDAFALEHVKQADNS